MSQYYYLVAALPYLHAEQPPPQSHKTFLEFARREISGSDFRRLQEATLVNFKALKGNNSLFRRFQAWEMNLRNALSLLRAARRKQEGEKFRREVALVTEATRAARSAFEAAHPLAAEEILIRARWDMLCGLETGHHFDVEFLIIYSLKLQLLERRARLSREAGEAAFAEIEGTLYEKITQGV